MQQTVDGQHLQQYEDTKVKMFAHQNLNTNNQLSGFVNCLLLNFNKFSTVFFIFILHTRITRRKLKKLITYRNYIIHKPQAVYPQQQTAQNWAQIFEKSNRKEQQLASTSNQNTGFIHFFSFKP